MGGSGGDTHCRKHSPKLTAEMLGATSGMTLLATMGSRCSDSPTPSRSISTARSYRPTLMGGLVEGLYQRKCRKHKPWLTRSPRALHACRRAEPGRSLRFCFVFRGLSCCFLRLRDSLFEMRGFALPRPSQALGRTRAGAALRPLVSCSETETARVTC